MGKSKQVRNRVGISQNERLSQKLSGDYVQIDEHSTTELLAFSTDFAKLIKYYDLNDNEDGNWESFFVHDVSIFLSTISVFDIQNIRNQEQSILDNLAGAKGLELYRQLFKLIQLTHQLAQQLNNWYVLARTLNTSYDGEPRGIELELEYAIENELNDYFATFRNYINSVEFESILGEEHILSYDGFSSVWDMETYEEELIPKGKELRLRISVGVKKIRVIYQNFYRAINYIVHRSKFYLEESITNNPSHPPHVALLITFIKLFEYSKNHINELTERHLDFYYRDILRQTPSLAKPDNVNVHFELADHVNSYHLPKGTILLSDNDEILYSTMDDLFLNQVRIAEIKTIFIEKNPLIGIGSSNKLISAVYMAPDAPSKDGLGAAFFDDEEGIWPTFGENQHDKSKDEKKMIAADLGFAIASPVLVMKEGLRMLRLTLDFDQVSTNTLNRLIKDISKNNRINKSDSFNKIFENAFSIYLTTKEGWLEISRYDVFQMNENGKSKLDIIFTLDPALPGIDTFEGSEFDSPYPVLRILINNDAYIYPYSFIKDLKLDTVSIFVSVKEVKDLDIYNELGRLDASKPFQPFGPIPKLGSYLLIGNAEIFCKELLELKLEIDWFDLPKEERGLTEYYGAYEKDIENSSFEISLSALSENKFSKPSDKGINTFTLFQPDKGNGENIHPTTKLDQISLENLGLQPNPDLVLDDSFTNRTRTGFLKLELKNPPMAFGHDIFGALFAETFAYNSKPNIGMLGKVSYPDPKPIPKQPYVPVIKSISLRYVASVKIHLMKGNKPNQSTEIPEKIFHIHPFGNFSVYEKEKVSSTYLFPQYNDAGNLFLGLENLHPPQEVSFYFQLKENQLVETSQQRPGVVWHYHSENGWVPLEKKNILLDTTENFMTSGIIKVKIPKEIQQSSEWLNANLAWLRIGVRKNVHLLAQCLYVKTQGVTAQRISDQSILNDRIAKNTLASLQGSFPEIQEIYQPFPSFGGKDGESTERFYSRVSERLRHKSRAITTWDYERLVLEQFPEVYQVKCIPVSELKNGSSEVAVRVIVIPVFDANGTYFEPKADYFLLKRIKEFLLSCTSEFTRVEVMNPVYEKLKISCGVIFTKGNNNGTHLEKLNMEIRKFINPWMFGVKVNLDIGGQILKDELMSAIQRLDYIQFITSFSIVHVVKDHEKGFYLKDTARDISATPVVKADRTWSVLMPSQNHPISFLEREGYQEPQPASIDTLVIGTDFTIRSEDEELSDRANYYISNFMDSDKVDTKDSDSLYFLDIPLEYLEDD